MSFLQLSASAATLRDGLRREGVGEGILDGLRWDGMTFLAVCIVNGSCSETQRGG